MLESEPVLVLSLNFVFFCDFFLCVDFAGTYIFRLFLHIFGLKLLEPMIHIVGESCVLSFKVPKLEAFLLTCVIFFFYK